MGDKEERLMQDIDFIVKKKNMNIQDKLDNISGIMNEYFANREKIFEEQLGELINKAFLHNRQIIYILNKEIFNLLHSETESEEEFYNYKLTKMNICPRCGGHMEFILKRADDINRFKGIKCENCEYKIDFFEEE